MANRTAQSHRHPADEDLLAWLEGDLVWLMEERLFSIAPVSGQELAGIRANLLQAMRAYENQPLLAGPFTTQLRGAIEEFLGARMSAQLSERILHASDPHAAYADVDRTFRLLLGAKAADGLKAKLLPEPPQ
jgi:hypothetical protein